MWSGLAWLRRSEAERSTHQEPPALVEGGEDDSADMEPVEEEFDLADVLGEDVGGSGSKEDLLRQAEQELEVCKALPFTCCCPVCFPVLTNRMQICTYLHNWTHGSTMLLCHPGSIFPQAVRIVSGRLLPPMR